MSNLICNREKLPSKCRDEDPIFIPLNPDPAQLKKKSDPTLIRNEENTLLQVGSGSNEKKNESKENQNSPGFAKKRLDLPTAMFSPI